MNKKFSLLTLSLITLTLFSCKKQDKESNNNTSPTNSSTPPISSTKELIDVNKYYSRLSNNIELKGNTKVSNIGKIDITLAYSSDKYHLSIVADFASLSTPTMNIKRGENNIAISESLNTNNEIEETKMENQTFSDFENPFKDLTADDYEAVDFKTFKLKDSSKSDNISSSLLKGIDINADMRFVVVDDKLNIVITDKSKNDNNTSSDNKTNISFDTLVLSVDSSIEQAYTIEVITPDNPTKASHMNNALKKMVDSNNNFTYNVKNSLVIKGVIQTSTGDSEIGPKEEITDYTYNVNYTSDGYMSYFDSDKLLSILSSLNNNVDTTNSDDIGGKKEDTHPEHGIYKHNDKHYKYTIDNDGYVNYSDKEVSDFDEKRKQYTPDFSNISGDIFDCDLISLDYSCKDKDLCKELVSSLAEDSDHKLLSLLVDKINIKLTSSGLLNPSYDISEIYYDVNTYVPIELITNGSNNEGIKEILDAVSNVGLNAKIKVSLSTSYTISDVGSTNIQLSEKPVAGE